MNVLLLLLLVACALAVITSQHRARRLFNELEVAQEAARKLDEEHTQLRLEQSTWGTHRRVEAAASKRLGMKAPEASNTIVVTVEPKR